MKTHSDRINPIRDFLAANSPILLDQRTEYPLPIVAERWSVQGVEIHLRIQPSGEWEAFVPATLETSPEAKVAALARYLTEARPDMETLVSMDNICDLFLDRLQDLPSCDNPKCDQLTCEDNRNLRQAIRAFKSKLLPKPKETANERP